MFPSPQSYWITAPSSSIVMRMPSPPQTPKRVTGECAGIGPLKPPDIDRSEPQPNNSTNVTTTTNGVSPALVIPELMDIDFYLLEPHSRASNAPAQPRRAVG